MSIAYADLEAVLRFREERTEAQRLLLNQYRLPLVSFTMNIAVGLYAPALSAASRAAVLSWLLTAMPLS